MVHLNPQPQIHGERPRDLPVVQGEKMRRGRAQSNVRDCRRTQCQKNIGKWCAIATCTDRPRWQTDQKIGKGKQCKRSVRNIGAYIELITECLSSKTKIVPASRQREGVGKIKIVVRRVILIICSVSNFEGAQYLDVRQASHLRVADTVYPHRLSSQRIRS